MTGGGGGPKTWTYEPDPDEPGVPVTFVDDVLEYVDRPLAFERFQRFQIATVDVRPRWRRVLDDLVWRLRHAVAALRGSSDECEP